MHPETDASDPAPDLCEQCCSAISATDAIWVHVIIWGDGEVDLLLIHAGCRPAYEAARAAA